MAKSFWSSLVAQTVKNLPVMQKTWVRSLGWEDPLEEGIATHSSILAWIIPMDTGTWGGAVHGGHKESDMTEQLSTTTITAGTSSIKIMTIEKCPE